MASEDHPWFGQAVQEAADNAIKKEKDDIKKFIEDVFPECLRDRVEFYEYTVNRMYAVIQEDAKQVWSFADEGYTYSSALINRNPVNWHIYVTAELSKG